MIGSSIFASNCEGYLAEKASVRARSQHFMNPLLLMTVVKGPK